MQPGVHAAPSYKQGGARRYPRATVIKRNSNGPSGPFFIAPSSPIFQTGLIAALIGFGIYFDQAASPGAPVARALAALHSVLALEGASPAVRQLAQWAVDSQDHAGLPFVIVDKARARLYAFDPQGRVQGSAPVLLGASHNDGPSVRATPAGRFAKASALPGRTDGIVWTHDGAQLSLHELPSEHAPGRALERLASSRVDDKRISDGSLHVAGEFFREYLSPLTTQASVAYVLPERGPLDQVFRSSVPGERPATRYAQLPHAHTSRRPS